MKASPWITIFAASSLPCTQSWSSFTPPTRSIIFSNTKRSLKYCGKRLPDVSMKVKVALIGLPNVGKSTLFNAIAQKSIADAKNFPFCTIEPNITPVPIPDDKLPKLANLSNSKKALSANIFFVDVAGLVKGASRGEGLGNQFLATVRECNIIIHVVRCYKDDDVIHVEGKVDPVADADVVNLELILADLEHVKRRLEKNTCVGEERETLLKIENSLEKGFPARMLGLSPEEEFSIKSMGLLTLKPVVYAFNVDEVDFLFDLEACTKLVESHLKQLQFCDLGKDSFCVVSAKLESDLAMLSLDERQDYLESIGVENNSSWKSDEQMSYHRLPLLVKDVLGLAIVYTGPGVPPEKSQTTKTHIVSSGGSNVLDFSGKLHGDIKKGFMHAEVVSAAELIQFDAYGAAKNDGKIRAEGKDYMLQDGDVTLIKWK